MRQLLLFCLSILLLAPSIAKAANAQAQEFDELGLALYRQGLYAKSVPYFQNAVQADPTDWEGYENLGNAYFKINANSEALSAYQKSLQLNPNNTTLENIVQSLQSVAPSASDNASANTTADNSASTANSSEMEAPPSSGNTSGYSQQPSMNPPPMGAAPPGNPQGNVESEQPIENNQYGQPTTIIVRHHHRYREEEVESAPTYKDNLAPMDHAKFWTKVEGGYSYTTQTDLVNSASVVGGSSSTENSLYGFNQAGAAMSPNGFNFGVELGFLLNPYNGIAFGVHYIQSSNYTLSETDTNNTSFTANQDYESATFSPYVIPITLDYYLFLPDHDGRFFISLGAGYYFGDVNVNESYRLDNYAGSYGNVGTVFGDLTAGAVGFQVSIGREFEINRHVGIEIFARGRYAKITNFQGVLSDGNTYGLIKYSDGSVDIDAPGAGVGNATVDFTGVDAGISFNWYSL